MKVPKQTAPIQRSSPSTAPSNQKGFEPSGNGLLDLVGDVFYLLSHPALKREGKYQGKLTMKLPKQAAPIQRSIPSTAPSNQKGVEPSATAFEELLRLYGKV